MLIVLSVYLIIMLGITPSIQWAYAIGIFSTALFLFNAYNSGKSLINLDWYVALAYVYFVFGDIYGIQIGAFTILRDFELNAAQLINQWFLSIYCGFYIYEYIFRHRNNQSHFDQQNSSWSFTISKDGLVLFLLLCCAVIPLLAFLTVGVGAGARGARLPIPSYAHLILFTFFMSFSVLCFSFLKHYEIPIIFRAFFIIIGVWFLFIFLLNGTRFVVLYVGIMTGMIFLFPNSIRPVKKLNVIWIFMFVGGYFTLHFVGEFMVAWRNSAYGGKDILDHEDFFRFFNTEGMLRHVALLLSYVDSHELRWGGEHITLLTTFIPKDLHPDKQPLLSSWLVHEWDQTTYGSGHSVTVGPGAFALADFGYTASIFECAIIGIFLAYLSALFYRMALRGEYGLFIVSFGPAATFFGMRSLETAYLYSFGVSIFTYIVLKSISFQNGNFKNQIYEKYHEKAR